MNCNNCGTKNPDGANFCSGCGEMMNITETNGLGMKDETPLRNSSEKVKWQAVSDRIFLLRRVFSPKTFPFHVCTMDAFGNGNKRLTEK